ncbi:MAG: translation initiation factor IF-2, partial [Bacteroidota bacterium]|nr:translation initiation factor IF-2 [Bacteroidota bacterium]
EETEKEDKEKAPKTIIKTIQEKPVEKEPDTKNEASKEITDEAPDIKVETPKTGEFKVVGKIDLSSLNQKTRPSKKSRKEKDIERKAKEKAKKEAQSDWKKKMQKIHSPELEKEAKKELAKRKAKRKPESTSKETKEETIKTNYEKLSGPTVVGKIDLPQKDKKKGKAKPVAKSTDEAGKSNKKRRKRIRKDRVDVAGKKPQQGGDRTSRKPGGKKRPLKKEVSEEDVQKQIKDTLARLTTKGKSKAAKYRRTKRDDIKARQIEVQEKEEMDKNILKVSEFVSVNELATMMSIPVNKIIATCMNLGLFVSINQRLDAETLTLVADEFGFEVDFTNVDVEEDFIEEDKEEDLLPRSPIVTVMGHVDHGKTSLLDYIRKANVIAGEAGGITQHIGAYSVTLGNNKNITFLDTPGHEAFTAMRARGAQVTDIAIIVVAADDNVMPQTIEAINHASAAGVPIVFAINKVDKPGANPEKIKEELSKMNYLVEDWGGKYQSQEISAKFGNNVDELLEKVLLEAEMLDLKGNPVKPAHGNVIESSLDKGRGYVATLLVQSGTLKVGDIILAGSYTGHVKAMFNERAEKIDTAGPSVPALILGLNGAPQAGDNFHVMSSEREAREIANKREQLMREQSLRTQKHITLDEIGRRLALGDFHEINIIVKGDVDGSIEALSDSLIKLSTDSVQVNIKHKAVGQISESDIMLAIASNAIVIGFQVRPSLSARKLAEKEQIDIRLYSIIYDAINEIRDAMEGMLSPDIKEEIIATLEIRETFKITKVGTIAGCIVKEGKITRNSRIRLIREGIVTYTGTLGSLKRFKDDVKEVTTGYECGLNVANFNDIKIGDIIEGFKEVEVKKKL